MDNSYYQDLFQWIRVWDRDGDQVKTLRSQLFIGGLLLIVLPALLLAGYYFRETSRTGAFPATIELPVAIAGATGIVLFSLLLLFWGFHRIVAPLRQLTEAAKAIREGHFDVRMEERLFRSGPLEVRELFYTFARMAEKINMQIRSMEKANAILAQKEERWQLALQGNKDGIWDLDFVTDEVFLSDRWREMFGYSPGEGPKTREDWVSAVHAEDLAAVRQRLADHLEGLSPYYEVECRRLCKDGLYKWVQDRGQAHWNEQGKPVRMVGSSTDIADRKQMEEKLIYYSMRDSLTGLYNRAYFQEELRRLNDGRYAPIAVIVCDVDGLKLYNDSFGHLLGDKLIKKAAELLSRTFRAGDVVARIGGDEFVVLLPHVARETVEKAIARLQASIAEANTRTDEFLLSMSIGMSISQDGQVNLTRLFREADSNMYREKSRRGPEIRATIIQTVVRLLEKRDHVADGHTLRVKEMCVRLAEAADFSAERIENIRLLAEYHDLGKVGIPDKILFKKGPLSVAEKREIQRHSEIGHRIALSVAEIRPVAEWILKHQEWWDGHGYPLGIAGDDIPMECRILAIADAYDSMTSDRPYRPAMSHEEAMQELQRCAGSQFDPFLIQLFSRMDPRQWTKNAG